MPYDPYGTNAAGIWGGSGGEQTANYDLGPFPYTPIQYPVNRGPGTTNWTELATLIQNAVNPATTNKAYNVGTDYLRRAQGGAVGGARAAAGAYGASRNLLNRGNFAESAASRVRQQFAPVFGQLEQGRSGALAELASKAFEMNFMLDAAKRGEKIDWEKLKLMQGDLNLRREALQAQIKQGEAGIWDWLAALLGPAAQVGSAAILASDRRVKQNIHRVGVSPSGIPTYEFEYVNSPNVRRFGVMAQDLLGTSHEQAVRNINGILHVNYSMIDVVPGVR